MNTALPPTPAIKYYAFWAAIPEYPDTLFTAEGKDREEAEKNHREWILEYTRSSFLPPHPEDDTPIDIFEVLESDTPIRVLGA